MEYPETEQYTAHVGYTSGTQHAPCSPNVIKSMLEIKNKEIHHSLSGPEWGARMGGQAIIGMLLLFLEVEKLFLRVLWPKKTIKTTFKVLGCKETEKIENF